MVNNMADASSTNGTFDLTEPVILLHPNLLVAKPFMKNGKQKGDPKFSGNFMFEATSEDLRLLKLLAIQIGAEKWPGRNIVAEWRKGEFGLPFMDGTKRADERAAECLKQNKPADGEFQRGKMIVVARSGQDKAPALSVIQGNRVVDLTDANRGALGGQFYFGQKVLSRFYLKAYEGGNGPDGVTAYLNAVCSVGGGERLAGGPKSGSEIFAGYAGKVTGVNPVDEEIPF